MNASRPFGRPQRHETTTATILSRSPGYSVLLRTFNSESTLPGTLDCLKQQWNPPKQYIVVDSGSTDRTLDCLPAGSRVHHYVGEEFNYAEALNQGLRLVSTDYVLIISSHTELKNIRAMNYALDLLKSNPAIGAAYFCGDNTGSLRHELIGRNNFTGFNGLFNTCAVIKVELLQKRQFRPEVFTSEDQEWAGWLFAAENKVTARISGAGMAVQNPRKDSLQKNVNEYVSVACFTNRKLLEWSHIVSLLKRAITLGTGLGAAKRKFYLLLSAHLMVCRYFKPRRKSRYF